VAVFNPENIGPHFAPLLGEAFVYPRKFICPLESFVLVSCILPGPAFELLAKNKKKRHQMLFIRLIQNYSFQLVVRQFTELRIWQASSSLYIFSFL